MTTRFVLYVHIMFVCSLTIVIDVYYQKHVQAAGWKKGQTVMSTCLETKSDVSHIPDCALSCSMYTNNLKLIVTLFSFHHLMLKIFLYLCDHEVGQNKGL